MAKAILRGDFRKGDTIVVQPEEGHGSRLHMGKGAQPEVVATTS